MKKIVLIILVLSHGFSASSQIEFDKTIIDDLSNHLPLPNSIYVSDADGDGKMDIFVVSADSEGKIVWYHNEGNGVFGDMNVIGAISSGVFDVFVADIDNDNDVDVIVCSGNSDKIMWFENLDGTGDFGNARTLTSNADGVHSIFAIDINGDNCIDVVSANYSENKIVWYKNLTNGNFSSITISNDVVHPVSVFSTDIDGDGDMDVLSASSYDSKIAWYENIDGLGNFSTQKTISSDVISAVSVNACDIDGDGDMDVLSASHSNGEIGWYENIDGLGSFSSIKTISFSDNVIDILAVDIDGDNDMDVLSASFNYIELFKNIDGLGNFEPPFIINLDNPLSIFASDIDGDGFIDIQSVSHTEDKIVYFKNLDGQGNFNNYVNISSFVIDPLFVSSADINGDGYKDVISNRNHSIIWYENINGSGEFSTQRDVANVDKSIYNVNICDIDGDGDNDILCTAGNVFKILWYENIDGLGNFSDFHTIGDVLMPFKICSSDLDNDGDLDVLMTSLNDDEVAWFENIDGNGNFGSQNVISTSLASPSTLLSIDLDGDGDNDIISSSSSDDVIAWFENIDGLGSFSLLKIISPQTDLVNSVIAKDIDDDGDMDIIYSTHASEIAWFENLNGEGNFGPKNIVNIGAHNYPMSIYLEDIDGDDDFDILSSTKTNVYWYENIDGEGDFGSEHIIGEENYSRSVFSFDIDNDNDLDVLSCYLNGISLYKNLGNLGFQKNALLKFSVFPNPTEELLLLELDSTIKQIVFFNSTGEIVLSRKTTEKQIDITSINEGIYILKVTDENNRIGLKKIIKN